MDERSQATAGLHFFERESGDAREGACHPLEQEPTVGLAAVSIGPVGGELGDGPPARFGFLQRLGCVQELSGTFLDALLELIMRLEHRQLRPLALSDDPAEQNDERQEDQRLGHAQSGQEDTGWRKDIVPVNADEDSPVWTLRLVDPGRLGVPGDNRHVPARVQLLDVARLGRIAENRRGQLQGLQVHRVVLLA